MLTRPLAAATALAAFLLIPGCGLFLRVAPASAEAPHEGTVLPTHRCGNAFLVDAMINGEGPFTLLLDTGAGVTAVSPAVAARLAQDQHWTLAGVVGATGKTATVHGRIRIHTLEAGGLRLHEFDALVMDTDGFEVVMGGKFDGVLGYPSFHDLSLTLDYPKNEARASPSPLAPSAGDVPIAGDDVPRVEFLLGDAKVRAILDSGSGGEIALAPGYADIAFATKPVPAGATLALGGSQRRLLGRASDNAQFAGVTLHQPLIETDAAINLVGAEVLKHFTVTFDARSGLARFDPQSPGPIAFEPLLGIGIGAAPVDGVLRIIDILPGSAAERAGLRLGDELLSLDGRPVGELVCERTRLFTHTGPATLGIRRDGQEMTIMCEVGVVVP